LAAYGYGRHRRGRYARSSKLTRCSGLAWLPLAFIPLLTAQAEPQPTDLVAATEAASAVLTADDELAEIRQLVQEDDTEGALSRIDAASPLLQEQRHVRYLRARLLAQQQRMAEALESLPDTSELPDAVALDIKKRRVTWLLRLGRCAEAQPLGTELQRAGHALPDWNLSQARCALDSGDANAALALLRTEPAHTAARFEVRYTRANALLVLGSRDAALAELRALYIEFPAHEKNAAILTKLKEHGVRLSDDERMARVERLIDAQRSEAAQQELSRISLPRARRNEPKALRQKRARLKHLQGMALFRMRSRYAEASKVLHEAATLPDSATAMADAYHAAQALSRCDQNRAAVRAYYAFAKRYPRERLAADAVERAAWLELRHNLPGGEAHTQAIADRAAKSHNKTDYARAQWALGFYNFTHKRYDQALSLFERYTATVSDPPLKARGLYWSGRSAAELHHAERAATYYRGAIVAAPLYWYALLAHARLQAAGEDPGAPFGSAHTPLDVSAAEQSEQPAVQVQVSAPNSPSLPDAAAFYADIGLFSDAAHALREREREFLQGDSDGGLLRLFDAYRSLGDHARPYILADRYKRDTIYSPPTAPLRPYWQALFPRPYEQEMALAEAAAAIGPDLVYAVMRQESSFNPKAVSNADAIGLLQLIERTAAHGARELGIAHFTRTQLYEPSVNIRLGSHYLYKLITRYRGQAVPAIAAYNAGEHRVDPWLERAARTDHTVELDWFVEDIPIEQTRDYVRRVVTNWARYLYVSSAQTERWPLELALTWRWTKR